MTRNLRCALLRSLVAAVVLVPTATIVAPPAGAAAVVECPASTGTPLRDLADALGKDLGTAYRPQYEAGDPCYELVAGREFTTLTPEIATFPSGLAPTPGPRTFGAADEVCDTATAHGQTCQVHSVVWDPVDHPEWGIVPQWIRDLAPAARRQEMVQLVTDVGEHFDGRIGTWTVVNEAFRSDGTLWNSVWNTDGDDSYIFDAFRAARLAAPEAELLYNDFGAEDVNAKSDAILDLATRLADEQVEVVIDGEPVLRPLIDGVGLQAHFGVAPGQAPDLASVAANVERLADAGLDVRITELDVRVPVVAGEVAAQDRVRQRELYEDTVAVCVAAESCRGVTLWGFTDRHSWITEHPATFSGEGAAHPFDLDYVAKPALEGIRRALRAHEGGYVPLDPARLVDTRAGRSTIDGRFAGRGPAGRAAPLTVDVTGRGGVAPSGVASVVLNVGVVDPTTDGYVTVHPAGGSVPTASNVNFAVKQTVSNLVVVAVGTGGRVTLSTSSPSIHLVVDVAGYFTIGSGFEPVAPARLADTRQGRPTVDGRQSGAGAIRPGSPLVLDVLGRAGVPASGVTAVALTVTVTAATSEGFVTVHPTGEARPSASNLNVTRGRTVANMVIAELGVDGRLTVFASPRSAHLVVDVSGSFDADGDFVAASPRRFVDTRPGRATVDGAFRGSGPVGTAVPGRSRIDVRVTGRGGVPGTGVRAVVLNVTAVDPRSAGHLTVFPTGSTRPNAANLNFGRGTTVPNLVIARVRANGFVSVHVAASATDVVIDVLGHFP